MKYFAVCTLFAVALGEDIEGQKAKAYRAHPTIPIVAPEPIFYPPPEPPIYLPPSFPFYPPPPHKYYDHGKAWGYQPQPFYQPWQNECPCAAGSSGGDVTAPVGPTSASTTVNIGRFLPSEVVFPEPGSELDPRLILGRHGDLHDHQSAQSWPGQRASIAGFEATTDANEE